MYVIASFFVAFVLFSLASQRLLRLFVAFTYSHWLRIDCFVYLLCLSYSHWPPQTDHAARLDARHPRGRRCGVGGAACAERETNIAYAEGYPQAQRCTESSCEVWEIRIELFV